MTAAARPEQQDWRQAAAAGLAGLAASVLLSAGPAFAEVKLPPLDNGAEAVRGQ